MAANLEIRLALPEDAAAIASVLFESFAEFKSLYTEGGFSATVLHVKGVRQRIYEGPVWVVSREGAVCGTVAAVVRGNSVYIRGMAVLPSARGLGAGTILLRQAEVWSASQGFRHIFLSTTPFLRAAIRLYENFGFRREPDRLEDLFGTPLYVMEKTIPGGQADSKSDAE